MKKTNQVFLAFTIFSVLVFLAFGCGKKTGDQKTDQKPSIETVEYVNCAVDGMKMEKSNMVKVEYQGKDYFVCNNIEKSEFLKNPDKYAKTSPKEEIHPE